MSDPLLSPSQSSHPLPPRPSSNAPLTSTSATPVISQAATPVQSISTTRGGFEFDDDVEDQEQTGEDGQDDDVYGTSAPTEVNGNGVAGDHGPLDRSSKSPPQENGMTPVPPQATDSPADPPSSVVSNTVRLQSALASNGPTTADQTSPDALSAVPKSRLAHDVVGMLEDRIKDDPRGDIPAWLELIEEYKIRNKDDQVRKTYERYLETFPLAGEQWCAFLRWEEAANRKWYMEQIFKKALISVPSVEVFQIYVNYVRRTNSMQAADNSVAYRNINQTFDFALKSVGCDKDSGALWQDYINFLKTGPGTVGGTSWQDSQKMDIMREAYGKALCMPTSALLPLWKEYEAFENGINKINGRKMLSEKSPYYMDARGAYTQLQNITRDVDRTSRPKLPPAFGYAGDIEYQQQVNLWKEWISWEKSDALSLKDENADAYRDRVIFTYKQALMALQFWPEMWYDAAEFCFLNSRDEQGLTFLNQGFSSNSESALLAFKLADRLESTSTNDNANDPGAKLRLKTVREPYDKVLDALYILVKKLDSQTDTEVQRIENSALQQSQANGEEELNASNVADKQAALDEQVQGVKDRAQAQSDMLSKIISHVWVALMRCTRRIQGKGMPSEKSAGFRAIFNEARKRGQVTPEFYVETALIEWNCYRDATGTRILERGVKLYPDDAYLPLEYIKHLIVKDDITNARAVFETTVNRLTSGDKAHSVAKVKPLFLFFHDYESKYGEMSQVVRLEARMRELFPEDPVLVQFSSRFQTHGFDPLNAQPIISPTQVVPKLHLQPSIEVSDLAPAPLARSPIQNVIDQITNINSPKRPLQLDEDDEDGRAPKVARGDSPSRGVQIRKIPAPPPAPVRQAPPPLPPPIIHLLSILPKASLYREQGHIFDPVTIHKLIKEKHLPAPGSLGPVRPPPTPQQSTPPAWPPHYPQQPPPVVPPLQAYMLQATPSAQYGAAPPYRYA